MTPSLLTAAACSLLAAAAAPNAAATFDGKVRPLAAGLVLVSADGTVHTVAKDAAGRLLYLDASLLNRDVRLTAKLHPGTRMLLVEKVQTTEAGKVYDIDYWCDNCQLAAAEPGLCKCCGGETKLRERPAK